MTYLEESIKIYNSPTYKAQQAAMEFAIRLAELDPFQFVGQPCWEGGR